MTFRPPALFLLLCVSAHADTLILKNGTRVSGRWWTTDATVVSFLIRDHLEQYARSEVAEVLFGDVASSAAPVETIAEPAQIGAVYFQQDSGALELLERNVGIAHGQSWELPGTRAAFRVKPGAKMQFVVRIPDGTAADAFRLYPLETKGNARRTKAAPIPITARKVAPNVYLLTPSAALSSGEYAFSATTSNDAYCFGIDDAAR